MFSVKNLPLIIFDCDGVLVDSEAIANQVLVKHIQQLGMNTSEDKAQFLYRGLSMATILKKIKKDFDGPLPENFLEDIQRETFSCFRKNLTAIKDVEKNIIELLKKGFKICVASSGSYEKIHLTLSITGLYSYFAPDIFSASEVRNGKPSPDLFLFAAEKMGFSANQCIVIEDSIPGIQAANRAGMKALAYCAQESQGVPSQFLESNAVIFQHMNALPTLISKAINTD
ncbi:MAG: HAD family hydrolase [Cellvibrionaceae bacterium]